ncbi:translesion DNA synthesis-associated protein ImuA [Marinobacter halodurans]|uniref:Translesion DNA synthesis-associated protein ImuA n=1 Tax=Marinobacter halodurans TaxID=2528979 RepID=A0ABY1ZIR3_9GAMM|nr:translesion DNA synthesis-associated protein ImuA [Marinobacter halodurans]TBW54598.1 translesion DNA synthesis-associated protein ImuA [Marinobacter halodurans]
MSDILDKLIDNAQIWQASRQRQALNPGIESTGFPALDAYLPGGGWPRGAMIECLVATPGIGELRLMLPALQRMTQAGQTVFWIDAPHIPYAPALARADVDIRHLVTIRTQTREDQLWTLENCLRSPVTGLAMIWLDSAKRSDIRRIQLAAEAGDSLCILFRHSRYADQQSPAALRLLLNPGEDSGQLCPDILKRRGGWPVSGLQLAIPAITTRPPEPASNVIRGPWPRTH